MEEFQIIPIGNLAESTTNPRRNFKGMEELTDSVRRVGVLVPLLVRPVNGELDRQSKTALAIRGTDTPEFEIIAGARRYRAAKAAGISRVKGFIFRVTAISMVTGITRSMVVTLFKKAEMTAVITWRMKASTKTLP